MIINWREIKKITDQLENKDSNLQKELQERELFWNREKSEIENRLNLLRTEYNDLKLNEQKKLQEIEVKVIEDSKSEREKLLDELNKKYIDNLKIQKQNWERLKDEEFENFKHKVLSETKISSEPNKPKESVQGTIQGIIDFEGIIKKIVNETFLTLRAKFALDKEYNGRLVLEVVKSVIVEKTMGAVKSIQVNKEPEKNQSEISTKVPINTSNDKKIDIPLTNGENNIEQINKQENEVKSQEKEEVKIQEKEVKIQEKRSKNPRKRRNKKPRS